MKRRTFLKILGAAPVALAIPKIAATEELKSAYFKGTEFHFKPENTNTGATLNVNDLGVEKILVPDSHGFSAGDKITITRIKDDKNHIINVMNAEITSIEKNKLYYLYYRAADNSFSPKNYTIKAQDKFWSKQGRNKKGGRSKY